MPDCRTSEILTGIGVYSTIAGFLPPGAIMVCVATCLEWHSATTEKMRNIGVKYFVTSVALLKWAHINKCPWNPEICAAAASEGCLESLCWARTVATPSCPWGVPTCAQAARHGNLKLLKWARDHDCSWNRDTTHNAVIGGHLPLLKWARSRDCPWKPYHICKLAAQFGRLDILKWLFTQDCSLCPEVRLLAVENGHLKMLRWLHNHIPNIPNITDIYAPCNRAAAAGQLKCLRWLRKNKYPWDASTCAAAASHSLEVLQWLRDASPPCPWDESTCRVSLIYGNTDAFVWARKHGCPWPNIQSCSVAASHGQLSTLKWLRNNGYAWNDVAAISALQSGNLDVITWVYGNSNGDLWDHVQYDYVWSKLIKNGRLDVLNWAYARGILQSFRCRQLIFNVAKLKRPKTIRWQSSGFYWETRSKSSNIEHTCKKSLERDV